MKKREFLLCFILISIFTVFFIPSSFLASNREIVEFGSFPQNPDYIQEIVDQFDKQPGVKVIDGTKYLYEDGRLYPFEPIRWIVLSEGGDNALLVSEKVLFTSGWNNDGWYEETMWSDGRVRKLLNNWFYDMAFDNAEKDCIHTSTNKTILRTSADGDTYDIETTGDNVFILSMAELPDAKEDCIAYPTKYSGKDSTKPCTYFARDIAEYLFMQGPVYVNKEGATIKDVPNANHGVRPAIRVNLSKIRSVNADKEKAKIKSLSNAIIKLQKTSYKYDGKVKRPEVTVLYEGKELSPSDYTVNYQDNKYAGTAVVEVTGAGRFSGTVKTTFTIKPGKKVTISFNGNGGKASKKSLKVKAGAKYGSLPSAKWKGYKFLGWFTKKKGGEQISDTSNLEKAKNQTLYAQWEKETYTISYELNGGTNSQKNPNTYTITTKTFSFKNPTRKGYVFKGWYTDSKFKKSIKKIAKGSSGNKVLYAKWTAISYYITFNGNSASSGKMEKKKCSFDKAYALPKNQFRRKGYRFVGWSKTKTGSINYYDGETIKNLISDNGKAITLYACWQKTIENEQGVGISIQGFDKAKSNFTYTCYYDEKYFTGSNSEEKAKAGLARLSAVAALSTYKSGQTKELLIKAGFDPGSIKSISTGTSSKEEFKNDNARACFGTRNLKDGSTLIAVIINGYTSGGYEWVSNFTLGTGRTHYGFETAANKLVDCLTNYIRETHVVNPKLWIAGHSRGGALTNLVAIKMINGGNYGITNSRVYAYGFATPRYTKDGGDYPAIINYISPHDFVPYVAPEKWGYRRVGTNILFNNAIVMKEKYKQYSGKDYTGYTSEEKDKLIDAFIDLGGDQQEYSVPKYWKKTIIGGDGQPIETTGTLKFSAKEFAQHGIGLAAGDAAQLDGVTGLINYAKQSDKAAKLTELLVEGNIISKKILGSHGMLTYLAWIDSLYPMDVPTIR